MRLFYASFLGHDTMQAYESAIASACVEVPNALRPVPRGTLHLTLGFLGQISEQDLEHCLEALHTVDEVPAFQIGLAPPSVLYARRTPRLVCVSVSDGADRVMALQRNLREGLRVRLPDLVIRPNPPHVTLARFRKSANRSAAQRALDSLLARAELPSEADWVTHVKLVRSTLTPQGPVYEPLAGAALRAGRG